MFALNISALEDEEPEQKSNTKYPVVYRHGKVVLKSGPSIHRKPANIVLDFYYTEGNMIFKESSYYEMLEVKVWTRLLVILGAE